MLLTSKKAALELGVCQNTLRSWANAGKIRYIRTPSNQRLYDIESLSRDRCGAKICYCRVSSQKQRDDLHRQVAYLQELYPEYEVVTDIGSGLNFKRKGLLSVLERAMRGSVAEIVVAHRDRLCRFGFDLLQWLVEQNGGKLVVLNDKQSTPEFELTQDLLSVIHVFACRMHGLRKYGRAIKEDKDLSNKRAEGDTASDTGDFEICV